MNSNSYLLNFVIPQGPTGPVGATGPAGTASGLSAYGGRYNNTSQTINLSIGSQTQVPLSSTMPSSNVTYTQANSITITQTGTYEINYYVNLSATGAVSLTLSVRNNGTNIPSAVLSRSLTAAGSSVFSGSTIVTLVANSTVDMALSSTVALGINLGSSVNASLLVKKISI